MTHNELNDIAKRWLLRPESGKGPGCKVAFVEVGAVGDSERADAWGYRWGWNACSVVVESKVSRSDFLRDRHKPHRQAGGMGDYRYFICPEGIINIEDLPDRWGLLWVNKRGHIKLKAGHVCGYQEFGYRGNDIAPYWRHAADTDVERGLLAYMVARVGDPDALLQEQRAYMRMNHQQAERIAAMEKDERALQFEVGRLTRRLEKMGGDGLNDPQEPIRRTMI